MNKRRIFIAINLPDGVRKRLAEWQENTSTRLRLPGYDEVNWVRRLNLHITLVFIGYATDDETYKICKTIRAMAKKHQPFSVNFKRITTGPAFANPPAGEAGASAGKPPIPRMFWVEGEESQELANLQNDLENALGMGISYKKEVRAFKPHITLARFKYQIAKGLPEINDAFVASIPVETIEVMQSNLKRGGPEYTILESIVLEGNEK